MGSTRGTSRARFPLVFLSASPPGEDVVWRRTVQIHSFVSISRTRHPDTADARSRACLKNDRVAPTLVVVRRPRYERLCERAECMPVR